MTADGSDLQQRLARLAAAGRATRLPTYVVGGFVRDLLLERPPGDLDVVVEGPAGSATRFARRVATDQDDAEVREHPEFLTATVASREGENLDVATARRETYAAPAVLPTVEPAPLIEDLRRRDFTANTLALRLWPARPRDGEAPAELLGYPLLDPLGGRRDLEAGLLRVLHERSFVDDPTRALRGVRLEARLGWRMDPETLGLLVAARDGGVFDALSAARLGTEVARLLADPAILLAVVRRLAELDLLAVLHPRLIASPRLTAVLAALVAAVPAYHAVAGVAAPRAGSGSGDETEPRFWLAVIVSLADLLAAGDAPPAAAARRELASRLGLAGSDLRQVADETARRQRAFDLLLRSEVPPHRLAEALEPLSGEEVLALQARAAVSVGMERAGGRIEHFLRRQRGLELTIGGRDLLARGASPGAALGEALLAVRRARLDGEISAGEELPFALARLGIE